VIPPGFKSLFSGDAGCQSRGGQVEHLRRCDANLTVVRLFSWTAPVLSESGRCCSPKRDFEVAQTVLILTRSGSEANKLRLPFRVKCLPRWRFGLVFFAVVSLPVTTEVRNNIICKFSLVGQDGFYARSRSPSLFGDGRWSW